MSSSSGEEVAGGGDYRRLPRRRWTADEKLAIVLEAERSGEPVAAVARRHGINANLLFNWRQRYRDGTLDRSRIGPRGGAAGAGGFIDLGVIGQGPGGGQVEIELAGGTKVRIGAGVSSETLGVALAAAKAHL